MDWGANSMSGGGIQRQGREFNMPWKKQILILHSPYISPDGSYIIFSRASQQRAQLGIFISFKKKDGAWGEAVCLNEIVGCPTATQCTYVTHDGKSLFFISWGSSNWASYWIRSDFIEKLRPKD
jgi:hypothetical protein